MHVSNLLANEKLEERLYWYFGRLGSTLVTETVKLNTFAHKEKENQKSLYRVH